jgi:hypothetical protein
LTVVDELTKAELGIALAATAKEGVIVELVTVGASQDGQDAEGAVKLVKGAAPLS